jgi:hypothetical protein
MSLSISLFGVFLAFCVLMGGVLAFCLRERRKIDGLDSLANVPIDPRQEPTHRASGPGSVEDETADNRVALVLFGTIIIGALLALITAYLVFFRDWG